MEGLKFNDIATFTSSLYLASLLASVVAPTVTPKLGRRSSIFSWGLLFCAAVVINIAAAAAAAHNNVVVLIIGRVLLGFAIQSTPALLLGMAPLKHRGALNTELQDMSAASESSKKVTQPWKVLLKGEYRPYLFFTTATTMFQQLIAITIIMFHAHLLLKAHGFGDEASLVFAAFTTCGVNVAATLLSIFTFDKWVTRSFFFEGGVQMFFTQILVLIFIGWKFGVSGYVTGYAVMMATFIYVYVAGFRPL